MLKINPLSTLYVGIDVSSKSNYVCALDFFKNKYINSSFANNQPGAEELALKILECLKEHPDITTIVAALESTSVYSIHIANYLSSCEELMRFKPYVFVLNPKCTANYKKSYIGLGKSDPIDAFVIADYARAGNIESEPWRGSQFLALKRLTRHRLHLVECMTREKTYLISNLYLKFSELQMLEGDGKSAAPSTSATNCFSSLATAVVRMVLASLRFSAEPGIRNSNLLPVKANGEVRLRSVVSLLNLGRTSTPRSIFILTGPA